MATSPIPTVAAMTVDDIDIATELEQSYMEYALSVIVARAIPDVRDGLKPVHRRVIYAMWQDGSRSERPHRKSIGAVGQTMKLYHPHGDSAIYETLVRMAQTWSMRLPLIDGHGNFGSRDQGPAASRYTEARLAPSAEALLASVDENTVDMVSNFDGSTTEPQVLPAAFPNLLVNGVQGIAVGISTSIPPHNLAEVVAACQLLAKKPKATVEELMACVPGPDFPTGGTVFGDGVLDMYRTGRGKFTLRATCSIEQLGPRRQGIVITELPYAVGPEKVISEVKERVNAGRIDGIADIVDLSDRRHGLRLVVDVRSNADPKRVLALLYKYTSLQTTFAANMVALVAGRPQTCNLVDLCSAFLEHRVDVVKRRSQYRLDRAVARQHVVEGLLIALDRIDLVVSLIRQSKTTAAARGALVDNLELTEVQADHILEMPLRRLTSLEGEKLAKELKELQREVQGLTKIVNSRKVQLNVVSTELDAVTEQFGSPRSSVLVSEATIAASDVVVDLQPSSDTGGAPAATAVLADDVTATVAVHGREIWRPLEKSRKSPRPVTSTLATSTASTVVLLLSDGRSAAVNVNELAEDGTAVDIDAFIDAPRGVTAVGLTSSELQQPVAFATANGTVKRVAPEAWPTKAAFERSGRDGVVVMRLADDDSIIGAATAADEAKMVLVTSDAKLLLFDAFAVRPQGAPAAGMAGIKLAEGSAVIEFAALTDLSCAAVVTATDAGNVKQTPLDVYPPKGRNTGGVRCMQFKKDDSRLVAALVADTTEWALWDRKALTADVPEGRRDGSGVPAGEVTAVVKLSL